MLFDLDGTVLDTEKLLARYWREAANEAGFPMTRGQALELRSLAAKYAAPLMKEWFGENCDYAALRKRRMELMNEHLERYGLETKPDVRELLLYLGEKGLKRAVVTATDVERAEKYLKMTGLHRYFDKIISAHMVENGKPQPDVYLYAARVLGLLPEECVAAEDSPNGVRSASSAGCVTVMVPDLSEPDEEIKSLIYASCPTLMGIAEIIEKGV